MKAQIICENCGKETKSRYPNLNPYPGEYIVFKDGKAKHPMICDDCGHPIDTGSNAVAFTIWSKHGRQGYIEWENDFLEISK